MPRFPERLRLPVVFHVPVWPVSSLLSLRSVAGCRFPVSPVTLFSATDIRAFKLRFKDSYTDGKILAFALPNGLDIFTLHPNFAKEISNIEYKGPKTGQEIQKNSVFLSVDSEDFTFPTAGRVIDINENIQEQIKSFSLGPTSNYILIMKPNKGMRQLEEPYVKIC